MNINKSSNNDDNNAIHIELPLRKSSTIPSYLKHACTVALIKHLLYVKKIIPLPPDDLLNDYYNELQHNEQRDTTSFQIHVDEKVNHHHHSKHQDNEINDNTTTSNVNKKSKRKDMTAQRKLYKCGEQLHFLLQDLNQIFNHKMNDNNNNNNSNNIKAVVITIGPSFHSPREQYVIRFHSWNHDSSKTGQNVVEQTMSSQKVVMERLKNEISRRVIREFIKGIIESDDIDIKNEQVDNRNVNKLSTETTSSNHNHDNIQTNINHIQNETTTNKRMKKSSRLRSKRNIRQNYTHHNSIGNSLSNLKLSVACLVCHDSINNNDVFHQQHDYTLNNIQFPQTVMSTTIPSHVSVPRFVIERDFVIKVPRMVSKKYKIYRPFVFMDIRPMLNPINTNQKQVENHNDESSIGPVFELTSGDLWVKLKSTIKGISVRVS